MTILVTGVDGYLGWPTLLKLGSAFRNDRIIAVDNFSRRAWVTEVGSMSAVPIRTMEDRIAALKKKGLDGISFLELDVTDRAAVGNVVRRYCPDVVVHFAAQPSAPYSEMNGEKASFTQNCNMSMTRNILWALREQGLTRTHFIETTTTGIYGAPAFEIPEGEIEARGSDGRSARIPCPNMASSWYHVSKGFNAVNMRLMHAQTGMPVSDVRTSIIYGTDTAETRESHEFANRFDFDYYFGTIFNRWIVMAMVEEPITIYGGGTQIKPFIHLEDAAQSIVAVVKQGNDGEHRIFNQLTEYVMIRDLARMIADHLETRRIPVSIRTIPNPRVEKENNAQRYRNDKFLRLLPGQPKTMRESISETIDRLLPHKERLLKNKKVLMK